MALTGNRYENVISNGALFHKICPHCSDPDLVTNSSAGDVICRGCASVASERIIDTEAEWRNYDNEDGGNISSAARSSGQADADDLGTIMMTGGDSVTRNLFMELSSNNAHDRKEGRIVKNLANISNICAKIGASSSIMVSRSRIVKQYSIYLTLIANDNLGPKWRHTFLCTSALIHGLK